MLSIFKIISLIRDLKVILKIIFFLNPTTLKLLFIKSLFLPYAFHKIAAFSLITFRLFSIFKTITLTLEMHNAHCLLINLHGVAIRRLRWDLHFFLCIRNPLCWVWKLLKYFQSIKNLRKLISGKKLLGNAKILFKIHSMLIMTSPIQNIY